jgi:hypothetical protein
MRVPEPLVQYFKTEFEPLLKTFLVKEKLLENGDDLHQRRYLNRSIAPHVETLSQLFNRIEKDSQTDGISEETYWSGAGSPKNRRLAYFLSFMPGNIFRVASVWAELHRLGWKWRGSAPSTESKGEEFRAVEFGAGTAAGACGVLAAEKFAPLGIPAIGSFALIEQSKSALQLGTKWMDALAEALGSQHRARPFHRRIDLSEPWLPKNAPQFHLMIMSYFLNETDLPPEVLARRCKEAAELHLENEGLIILVEPALKQQSRKLLEFRKALIELIEKSPSGGEPLKVLLPCLGHQVCGALAKPEDWCHEEVSWWRPPYLQELDAIVGLDRRSLPFSYLVIQKTHRSLREIFPALTGTDSTRYRLVSPSRALGKKDLEFYMCGQDGKRRTRYRLSGEGEDLKDIDRGDILQETTHHGEPNLTQIDRAKVIKK